MKSISLSAMMSVDKIGFLCLKDSTGDASKEQYVQFIKTHFHMSFNKFINLKGEAKVLYLNFDHIESVVFHSNKIHYCLSSVSCVIKADAIRKLFEFLDYEYEIITDMFAPAGSLWLKDIVQQFALLEADKKSFCLPTIGYSDAERSILDVNLMNRRLQYVVTYKRPLKQSWIQIKKGDVFEIPEGIKSLKVSLRAEFILSDDYSNRHLHTETSGEIYNKIFGNIKPWYYASVKHYRRFVAKNDFYIKLSTDEQPLLYKITKNIILVPNTLYKIYKLLNDKWDRFETTTNKSGDFEKEYYDCYVAVP